MGVRHLDNFIRESVPGGYFRINIEEEIRKYFDTPATPNPPAPIIVIDLITLYTPLSQHDPKGLLFGGRFNLAHDVIDTFFTKLKSLGAKLEFFFDGPVPESKNNTWSGRQDRRYTKMLELVDAVDRGIDIDTLTNEYPAPLNFQYPLKNIAKKYGEYRVSLNHECDQELAAHATKAKAFAIISDDSDFLIYEGSWKYWSSRQLELATLYTVEYNRAKFVNYLGLSFEQMPLLATLSGNDIMPYDVMKYLHYQLGGNSDKFPNMAQYIREISETSLNKAGIINILKRVTKRNTVNKDLVQRFQLSLNNYSVNFHPRNVNPTKDLVLEALIEKVLPFAYLTWLGKPNDVSISLVDMRRNDFGRDYAQLQISLFLRTAGIILCHRKPQRPTHLSINIKMTHQSPHRSHSFPVQYPSDIEPPTLPDLLSKDPVIHEDLLNVKYQLLAWTASDTLNPVRLRQIPHQLRMTVFTLYYLLEQKVLELFEADLFLQVAYDVAFETYDFTAVHYPSTVQSRPFRLVFFYQKIYAFTAKVFRLVGLDNDEDFRDDPPFDGVLFHKRYDEWSCGRCELDQIKEWRIYEGVVGEDGLKSDNGN